MRVSPLSVVLVLLLSPAVAWAQTATKRSTLDIYVVDVEGGNAVLFVTPSGEPVLIDSGNGGPGAVRDAERIVAAAKDAFVTKIDHLITTRYHNDHVGGLAELAARIPIRELIDHGANAQANPNIDAFLQGRNARCRECSSPTSSTSRSMRCRWRHLLRYRKDSRPLPHPNTTGRRTTW